MRLAALPAFLAILLGAPLAAQSPVHDSSTFATVVPSLVFADAARAGAAIATPADTLRKRRRAIEHSDAYYTRLTIHRWASYTMPPLFVAQYVLGNRLIDAREKGDDPGSTKDLHSTVAGAIGGLFVINTATGAWNLWEDRHSSEGRTRRTVHAVSMLVADAGFVATGVTASHAGSDDPETHRNLAYGSMAIALASGAMMWFWKD